jgi:hypothetical protein
MAALPAVADSGDKEVNVTAATVGVPEPLPLSLPPPHAATSITRKARQPDLRAMTMFI